MTIVFSDEELKWIDKKPFNWSLKNECPEDLKTKIKRKLDILNEKTYSYEEGFKHGSDNKRPHR